MIKGWALLPSLPVKLKFRKHKQKQCKRQHEEKSGIGRKTKMATTPTSPTSKGGSSLNVPPTTPTRTNTLGKKEKGGWMGTLTRGSRKSKKEGICLAINHQLRLLLFPNLLRVFFVLFLTTC